MPLTSEGLIKGNGGSNAQETFNADKCQSNSGDNYVKPQHVGLERQVERVEEYYGHCQSKRPADQRRDERINRWGLMLILQYLPWHA